MTKEKYVKPIMEVVDLKDDVILTSGGCPPVGICPDTCSPVGGCTDICTMNLDKSDPDENMWKWC